MTRPQRIVFEAGYLVATAVAATIVGILFNRIFPDRPWLTLIGPLSAVSAVIALRRLLSTRLP